MVRIGYQGEVCSNSEEAALRFATEYLGLQDNEYVLVPLVESRSVVSNLKSRQIDYGVMATKV